MRLLEALLIPTLLGTVVSFPNGAPKEACTDMTPKHTGLMNGSGIVSPQSIDSPYTLTLGSNHYDSEEAEIEVVLSGPIFFGFIIQAQCATHPSHIVGEFELSTGVGVQHIDCDGNGKGTVTHTVSYSRREDHDKEDVHHEEHDLTSPHPDDGHSTTGQPSGGDQLPIQNTTADTVEEEQHNEHHDGISNPDESHHTVPVTGGPTQYLRLHWRPGTHRGDVIFKATAVQHQVVFWTELESTRLVYRGNHNNGSGKITSTVILILASALSVVTYNS